MNFIRWIGLSLAGLSLVACADVPPQDTTCAGVGTICRWAGTGQPEFTADGLDRTQTSLNSPLDLSFAADGRAYVIDWQNHRIRRVNGDGKFETVMGADDVGDGPPDMSDLKPPGAPGTTVSLNHPTDINFFPDGRVLVAAWHNHKIRVLDPATGLVTVLCGRGPGGTGDGLPVSSPMVLINQPKTAIVAADGAVLVTDSRNQKIRRIGPDGIMGPLAGRGAPEAFGGDEGPLPAAAFDMQKADENPEPGGSIALDAQDRIYLADTFNERVRLIDPKTNTVTTIAGTGTMGFSGDGGPAVAAQLAHPRDIELGPDGRLYIADTDNNRVRVVDLTTGIISTVAGVGDGTVGDGNGGLATQAVLRRPFGIAFDGAGNLYIADTLSNTVRKVVMQ